MESKKALQYIANCFVIFVISHGNRHQAVLNVDGTVTCPNYRHEYGVYPKYLAWFDKNIKVNFSHSKYQFITLKKSGIKSLYLSDRIRNEYFRGSKKVLIKDKKNI